MEHCKDCLFWTRYSHPSDDYGRCSVHSDHEVSLVSIPGDEYGEVETKPDFGCVQFQQRNEQPINSPRPDVTYGDPAVRARRQKK